MLEPMRIFLDTDIGPDCDDAGALAILLSLCRQGKARLIGAAHCTGSPYGLAAIDAICKAFGVRAPLGSCPDKSFLTAPEWITYSPAVANLFPNDWPVGKPQPDAVDMAAEVLASQPDGSVTLIGIGPMNNIARYLTEEKTRLLMRRKVCRILLMAGQFDTETTAEWNVKMDVPAARTVFQEWRGPMDLAPFEAYSHVLTGACLKKYPENPVAIAYRIHNHGAFLRPSWDLGAVLAAVIGPEEPYAWSEPGRVTVDETGVSRFTPCAEGTHRYVRLTGTNEEGAALIEGYFRRACADMAEQSGR